MVRFFLKSDATENAETEAQESELTRSANCRTRRVNLHLWVCLASLPVQCPFAAPFGRMSYCLHSDAPKFEQAKS